MKPLIYIFQLFFLVHFIGQVSSGSSFPLVSAPFTHVLDTVKNKPDSIRYKIIDGINHSYGYDIFINSRMAVHQPFIPCLPGNKGFSTKEDARKVALRVMGKIRKGEMPPTLTLQELKNLGVVH